MWLLIAAVVEDSGVSTPAPVKKIKNLIIIIQKIFKTPDEIKINTGGNSSLDHIPLIAKLKFKEKL